MKKLFLTSLILLTIVLILLGVYNFSFKKKDTKNDNEVAGTELLNNKLTTIEKIAAVTEDQVISTAYDKKKNSIVYFDAKSGSAWQINGDGKEKKQIFRKIDGMIEAKWSSDLSKVLATVEKNGSTSFVLYDQRNNLTIQLKKGLDEAVWDGFGAKIFYKYYDQSTKERTLNIANYDGSEWKKLSDLDFKNVIISQIPQAARVSYWNSPKAGEETKLNVVGISGEAPQTIFTGKFGADYLWSPDGTKALVSSLDTATKKMTLGMIDLKGEYKDLGVPTFVSKVTWSSDGKNIYYALAGNVSEKWILPDDYILGKVNTKDTFWKMDITNGQRERIVELEHIQKDFDATDMFLSATEDALFFTNKIDKKLYKIEF